MMTTWKTALALIFTTLIALSSPVEAKFYSNDPVDTLQHIKRGNVQGFNRYAYANNNPYRYVDPDGKAPESLQEWKNLGLGALTVAGSFGEAIGGTVLAAGGAADVIAGTKAIGLAAIGVGTYLVHDSKHTFTNGANKITNAWNNTSGSDTTKLPEGPLQSTAADLGCSANCQAVAGEIDKGLEMLGGKGASTVTSGMKAVEALNTAGDIASHADKVEKIIEKAEQ